MWGAKAVEMIVIPLVIVGTLLYVIDTTANLYNQ
jgi:hypothetical protein